HHTPPLFLFVSTSFPITPPRPPTSTLFPYTTLFRSLSCVPSPARKWRTLAIAPSRVCTISTHVRSTATIESRAPGFADTKAPATDRKSTRLNSSHRTISYAVFCLKKKNKKNKKKQEI